MRNIERLRGSGRVRHPDPAGLLGLAGPGGGSPRPVGVLPGDEMRRLPGALIVSTTSSAGLHVGCGETGRNTCSDCSSHEIIRVKGNRVFPNLGLVGGRPE